MTSKLDPLSHAVATISGVINAYNDALTSSIYDEDNDDAEAIKELRDAQCEVTSAERHLKFLEDVVTRHSISEERMKFIIANEERLVEEMAFHGGTFASRIANAWAHSDEGNRQKLRESFGNMLYTYKQFLKAKV